MMGQLPAGGIYVLTSGISAAGHYACCERVAPLFGPDRHKKTGSGTPGPNPVLTCSCTALSQCPNKRPAYFRSKRSFCITLVHAATKSLTYLSSASSAA